MCKSIILIVGETACGKDTLTKYLKEAHGLRAVCSYTTREKRPSETEGKEHYFITDSKADRILDSEEIVAYTKIGNFRYFATKSELEKSDIYIIDPNGIAYLKENHPDVIPYIVYVTCDKEIAISHAAKRGDDKDVLSKRIEAEKEQFETFVKNKGYDRIILNNKTLDDLYREADDLASVYQTLKL